MGHDEDFEALTRRESERKRKVGAVLIAVMMVLVCGAGMWASCELDRVRHDVVIER